MPLSEHEQHLLEQMEQALYAEDPKFASQMQGSAARARLRRGLAFGAGGIIVGLGLVVLGVTKESVWWGAIGFALMVSGVAYAISPAKVPKAKLQVVDQDGSGLAHEPAGHSAKPQQAGKEGKSGKFGKTGRAGKRPKANKANKETFMRRLESRWDRRRHDGQ